MPEDKPSAKPEAPAAPPKKPAASPDAASANEGKWGGILAVLFWLVVIGYFAIPRWWAKSADIILEVLPTDAFAVNGVVLYNGSPVSTGYVRLTLDEPKTKRFLSSTIASVTNQGGFAATTQFRPGNLTTNKQLRITAAFEGQTTPVSGKAPDHVSGEAVVYTNYSPPIKKINLWSCVVVTLGFIGLLMVLFTGSLSRRKARCLFAVTYLCTFVSLAVPLALILTVSQNNYLVEVMQESPVGLVKAKAKGVDSPQWLLNIGGIVQSESASIDTNTPASTIQALNPGSSGSLFAADNPAFAAKVIGGLAIPFYVVILAMFGAGINMTRQVPDIQRRHDLQSLEQDKQGAFAATFKASIAIFSATEKPLANAKQTNVIAGIRKEIIESYMGLLSAPFLAIAIYYMLQIIATSVAEPILVVMAFGTGLISDTVVTWIITFAQTTLGTKAPESGNPADAPGPGASTSQAADAAAHANATEGAGAAKVPGVNDPSPVPCA